MSLRARERGIECTPYWAHEPLLIAVALAVVALAVAALALAAIALAVAALAVVALTVVALHPSPFTPGTVDVTQRGVVDFPCIAPYTAIFGLIPLI